MKDLDLERKGYLSIEDFVCFINLSSGNFFRNRDVMMVFKRFMRLQINSGAGSQSKGVDYSAFLDKVTYE